MSNSRLLRAARGRAAGLLFAWLLLLLGACGGAPRAGEGPNGSTGTPTPAAGQSTLPDAVGTADVTAKAFPTTTASPEPEKRRCIGLRFVSPHRGAFDGIRIWARPDVVQGWGCGNIIPGRECRIGWNGNYAGSTNENYIRFVAWERGKPEPVSTVEVGPLPLEGQFTTNSTKFSYVVGETDKVRFYLQLLDAAKIPIATSDTFVYHVRCKG